MYLGELINYLEKIDPDIVVPLGFYNPHSYRGYYECLAFEPTRDIKIGRMLTAAQQALGSTYRGYKGGEYTMHEYTTVYLADYGSVGEEIGPVLLSYMFGEHTRPVCHTEQEKPARIRKYRYSLDDSKLYIWDGVEGKVDLMILEDLFLPKVVSFIRMFGGTGLVIFYRYHHLTKRAEEQQRLAQRFLPDVLVTVEYEKGWEQ